jgi:peptidoglycan/xylan/chitin deacetylase (PgdA/CDA1 family)
MELRISIDDGCYLDLKILDYLIKYDLNKKACFYIPPDYSTLFDNDIRKIAEYSEVGGHTLNHKPIRYLSDDEAFCEVMFGKMVLENIVEKEITKFAYPKGWYSDNDIETVKFCGFSEAVSMKLGIIDKQNYSNYEIPRTAHIYPREEYRKKGIVRSITDIFNEASKQENGYFNLAMHSWEIQKFGLWGEFDEILKNIYNYNNKFKKQ